MEAMPEVMTFIEYMANKFVYEKKFALFFEEIEWEEVDGL